MTAKRLKSIIKLSKSKITTQTPKKIKPVKNPQTVKNKRTFLTDANFKPKKVITEVVKIKAKTINKRELFRRRVYAVRPLDGVYISY